jgi:acyl carrier protein
MSFDRNSLEQELKQFLIDQLFIDLSPDEIRTDMSLASEVGVDSLGFTEMVAHLEDCYQLRIRQEDLGPENFRNLDSVMAFVLRKRGVAE